MTEFSIEPYRKVSVKSYMRYESADAWAKVLTQSLRGMGGRIGNYFWANGIMFKHANYAASDNVTKQYLDGHLPLDHIEYAPMPEFRSEIRIDDAVVTVVDVSANTLFRELTKWIKETLEKSDSK